MIAAEPDTAAIMEQTYRRSLSLMVAEPVPTAITLTTEKLVGGAIARPPA